MWKTRVSIGKVVQTNYFSCHKEKLLPAWGARVNVPLALVLVRLVLGVS